MHGSWCKQLRSKTPVAFDLYANDDLCTAGHPGGVRGPHEQQPGSGLCVCGEDRAADVLSVGGHRAGSPRLGGRDLYRRRGVPRVPDQRIGGGRRDDRGDRGGDQRSTAEILTPGGLRVLF